MVQPLPSWKINNKTVKNIGFHFFPHVVTLYVSFFEIGPFNQVTCYSKFLFGRVRCCCPYSLIFGLYLQTPHLKQTTQSIPQVPFSPKNPPKKSGRLLLTSPFQPSISITNFPILFFPAGRSTGTSGGEFFRPKVLFGLMKLELRSISSRSSSLLGVGSWSPERVFQESGKGSGPFKKRLTAKTNTFF